VHVRPDGSYVVNGGRYHVPNAGEFSEVWAAIHEYVQRHPDVLRPESLPVLPEQTEEERLQAAYAGIDARLEAIDRESIRPLRAIADGSATDADTEKLAALAQVAAALREERRRLLSDGQSRENSNGG